VTHPPNSKETLPRRERELLEGLRNWASDRRRPPARRTRIPIDAVREIFRSLPNRNPDGDFEQAVLAERLANLERHGLITCFNERTREKVPLPVQIWLIPVPSVKTPPPPMPKWHADLGWLAPTWPKATDRQRAVRICPNGGRRMTEPTSLPSAQAVVDEWSARACRPGLKRVMRAQVDAVHDRPATARTREILEHLLVEAADYLGHGLDHVAEAGCGIGRLTDVLAGRARHVTAIDFIPGMLAEARARWAHLGNVDFRLSRLQDFAWGERRWDVAVTVWVLMHILDEADLARLCQAMRSASRLVITGEYTRAATLVGAWSRLRPPQRYADLLGGRILARDTLVYAGDVTTFMLLDTGES